MKIDQILFIYAYNYLFINSLYTDCDDKENKLHIYKI